MKMELLHHARLRCQVLMLACFMALSVPGPVAATDKLIMGSHDPIESTNGRFYNLLYREAVRRLGLEFEYVFLPAKRASAWADEGRLDGELARIKEYGENHPNLVRVEEAGMDDAFCAFSTKKSIRLEGWESLQNTPWKVEYMRGVFRAETILSKTVPPANLSRINAVELGLKRLVESRTDIFIDSEAAVKGLLSTPDFIDSGIQKVGIMEETRYYAYLHIRHKDLALKLAEILKQMKADGEIERYHQQALGVR